MASAGEFVSVMSFAAGLLRIACCICDGITIVEPARLLRTESNVGYHDPALARGSARSGFYCLALLFGLQGAAARRTVVQMHAMGPFAMTYVNPVDAPRK